MIMPILDVRSVDETIAFFCDKLGFEARGTMQDDKGNNVFGFVGLGDVMIGVGLPNAGATMPASPAPGVEFMVYLPPGGDIDAHYADVQKRGVAIHKPIANAYWGDRIYSVKDPNGYLITMTQTIKEMTIDEAAAARGSDVVREP